MKTILRTVYLIFTNQSVLAKGLVDIVEQISAKYKH
jgi:hypothetical protein